VEPARQTGGAKVAFTDTRIADIANEIYNDELLHVKYLRTALGGVAVAEPHINLNALGIGFDSQAEFLTLARAFEDTGVSTYAGAATLLTGNNHLRLLPQLIEVRVAADDSLIQNEKMFPLISQVNGRGIFWVC
jgi:hypothetical protein